LDQRKTALARASRIYKRQTRPLVREDVNALQKGNLDTTDGILSGPIVDEFTFSGRMRRI
jgi:hypothetical protein